MLPPPLPRQQAPRPPQAPPSSGPVTPWPPRHGPWSLSFKHQWWGLCFLPPSWAPGCCVLAGQGHKGPSRTLSLTFSSGEGPAWGAAGGFRGGPACALSAVLAGPLAAWGLPRQGLWAPRPGRDLGLLPHPPPPRSPQAGARPLLSFSPGYSFGANLAPEGTCKWLFAPHRKTSLSASEDVSRNSLCRPPTCSSPGVAGWPRPQGSGGRGAGPTWASGCPAHGDLVKYNCSQLACTSVTRSPTGRPSGPSTGGGSMQRRAALWPRRWPPPWPGSPPREPVGPQGGHSR